MVPKKSDYHQLINEFLQNKSVSTQLCANNISLVKNYGMNYEDELGHPFNSSISLSLEPLFNGSIVRIVSKLKNLDPELISKQKPDPANIVKVHREKSIVGLGDEITHEVKQESVKKKLIDKNVAANNDQFLVNNEKKPNQYQYLKELELDYVNFQLYDNCYHNDYRGLIGYNDLLQIKNEQMKLTDYKQIEKFLEIVRDNIEQARDYDFTIEIYKFNEIDLNGNEQKDSIVSGMTCCMCDIFKMGSDFRSQLSSKVSVDSAKSLCGGINKLDTNLVENIMEKKELDALTIQSLVDKNTIYSDSNKSQSAFSRNDIFAEFRKKQGNERAEFLKDTLCSLNHQGERMIKWEIVFKTIMEESNSLIANMLSIDPPDFFLSNLSRIFLKFVQVCNQTWEEMRDINLQNKSILFAYNFDHSSHCSIITLNEHVPIVEQCFSLLLSNQRIKEEHQTIMDSMPQLRDELKDTLDRNISMLVGELEIELYNCRPGQSAICMDHYFFDFKAKKMKPIDIQPIDQRLKSWERIIVEKFGRKLNINVHTEIFEFINNYEFVTEEELMKLISSIDYMYKETLFDDEIKLLKHKHKDNFEFKMRLNWKQFDTLDRDYLSEKNIFQIQKQFGTEYRLQNSKESSKEAQE